MTKKAIVSEILKRTIWILAGIQIVIGVLWCLGNLGSLQPFQEIEELQRIANTMVTDEYVGILYPILIKLAQEILNWLPIPYFFWMYVLQIGVGLWTLVRLLHKRKGRYFIALAILSTPVVLQLCMAVLPQSLAVWTLLLCMDYGKRQEWIKGSICWLLSGLFIPEYFVFAGLLFLGEGIYQFVGSHTTKKTEDGAKKQKIDIAQWILCVVVVSILFGTVWTATVEVYSQGRMARTPYSMALRRVVWPHFSDTSFFWEENVTTMFDTSALRGISQYPEQVLYTFGTKIEEAYGQEKAQSIYQNMVAVTFQMHTRQIVSEIGADLLQSAIPSVTILMNLHGIGVSYSGWNYECMSANTPVLTKYYVNYAGVSLFSMLILALCYVLWGKYNKKEISLEENSEIGQKNERKDNCKNNLKPVLFRIVPIAVLQIVFYTMAAAGMQNYLNLLLISVCWGYLLFSVCAKE